MGMYESAVKINEDLNMSSEADEFILSVCNNSVRILINYLEKIEALENNSDTAQEEAFQSVDQFYAEWDGKL